MNGHCNGFYSYFRHSIVHLIFILSSLIAFNDTAKLPLYITPCSRSDPKMNECALINGQAAVENIVKGDEKYHIPNMLPLKIPEIQINGNGALKIKLMNVECSGLENSILQSINIDLKNQKVSAKVFIPNVNILGQYDVKGRILIVPIVGNGPANFTFVDATFDYSFNFDSIQKKDKEYYRVLDSYLEYETKRAYFHLDNLFEGDPQLGTEMNNLLDGNWREVLKDIGPAVSEAVSIIISTIFTEYLNRVPVDELFLP